MTLVKFNRSHDDFFPSLSRFFDDFAPTVSRTSMPAVNIKETENSFQVELAAPGLDKADFQISIDENVLKISAEKQSKHEEEEEGRYSRREFSYQSFARSFTLPDTVDQEAIAANYKEGVLSIRLPKRAEEEVKASRTIEIS